jgi:hypothetical protein
MSRSLKLTILLLTVLLGLSACGFGQAGGTPAGEIDQPQAIAPGSESSASEPALPEQQNSADFDCQGSEPHPIGSNIAQTYEVPYEEVIGWFCEGYSFENILIALETSEATDVPAATLLEMLLEKDWEVIWDEIGLTD